MPDGIALCAGCDERFARDPTGLAESPERAGCETLSAVTGGIARLLEWPVSVAFEAPMRPRNRSARAADIHPNSGFPARSRPRCPNAARARGGARRCRTGSAPDPGQLSRWSRDVSRRLECRRAIPPGEYRGDTNGRCALPGHGGAHCRARRRVVEHRAGRRRRRTDEKRTVVRSSPASMVTITALRWSIQIPAFIVIAFPTSNPETYSSMRADEKLATQ
jgi:hypothetical protein